MSERKSYTVFPATEMAIIARVNALEEKVSAIGQSGVFGMDDGDAMDDDEMLRARVTISELHGEIADMNGLLGANRVWTAEDVHKENFDIITLGSKVNATVRYPEGEEERLEFSVGSPLDADVRFNQQDSREHSIVSIEAPFAQAILGAKMGETVSYESQSGKVSVKVENVSRSQYLPDVE